MSKATEPTANLRLAEALRGQHPHWKREGKLTAERQLASDKGTRRPDLLLRHSSLTAPIGIETEFTPAATVEQEAQARLGLRLDGAIHPIEQCFAVKLDASLVANDQDDEWADALTRAKYEFCLYLRREGAPPERWPARGWITGSLSVFAQSLECATLSPSLLAQGMDWLQDGVRTAADALAAGDMPHVLDRLGSVLKQEAGAQTTRMAVAIIANALNFHLSIATTHDIATLEQMRDSSQVHRPMHTGEIVREWERILREINYWPIFRIAVDLLLPIPEPAASRLLTILADTAERLAGIGVTSLHDMSGRMLQQLIADRKFLATFYTQPLSAALLAELAISRIPLDGVEAGTYLRLRVGDFACGTGTLISAAYQALLARYRRTGRDDRDLHQGMMEYVLYALDVMPVATHLTASQLASAHPGVTFNRTQIHTMEYGVNTETQKPMIGSLELLDGESKPSLFHTHEQIRGDADAPRKGAAWVSLTPGTLDLAIMNPPFTRPTNHEATDKPVPSFAGFDTSAVEQTLMKDRLAALRCGLAQPVGHGNAGLASNFIDIAEFFLKKEQGTLALVLPLTFLQGSSWRAARELLVRHYVAITVLSLAQSVDRCWSADTNMAEVMVLATRASTKPANA